jgi:exopolysaccharide production protein ExoQ
MRQFIFNPAILLLLLLVGVIYLLLAAHLVDRKSNFLFAKRLVIILFLFTGLNITFPPFIYLYPEALSGFDKTWGSALLQLSIYTSFAFILRSWFSTVLGSFLLLFKDLFLGLLLILAPVSAIWSETPDISLRAGLVLFFTSVFSAHIVKDLSWRELSKLLRQLTLIAAFSSIALIGIASSIAIDGKGLRGVFPFPIKLGTFMALGIALWTAYLFEQYRDRWKTVGIISILTSLLILSNSGQGIIVCFSLVSLVILLKILKKTGKLAIVLALFYSAASILLVVSANTLIPKIFGFLNKDETLTGRTTFWPQLIERLLAQHPILGYGLNGFWQGWRGVFNPAVGIMDPATEFIPPHAHNGFLDLALALGLVGLLLFSLSFIIALIKSIRHFMLCKSSEATLPLLLLAYIILANLSETQLLGSSYIWILYIMVVVRLSLKPDQIDLSGQERLKNRNFSSLNDRYLPEHDRTLQS